GLENIIPSVFNATDVFLKVNMTADFDSGTVMNEAIFTPTSLEIVALIDPKIHVTLNHDLTFILLAKGGVGAWTWLDHP
ncbi:hypothetical protein K439DRAFT_1251049, partial [Ramaria rubella]